MPAAEVVDAHVLTQFRPAVREWFSASFSQPTRAQALGWPSLLAGDSTLILAPTGSGKTLTAFLHCLDRLMFTPAPDPKARCRVLYVSPIKALAVDVEKNLRAPLEGIARQAEQRGDPFTRPQVAIRTGDTPAKERARFLRQSADILITTPESLYLMLTSGARETLRHIETVILDEIHVLVPSKRGAHLALSLERLQHLVGRPIQRVGLSATQRPLDEVARYLAGLHRVNGVRQQRPVRVIDASGPKSLSLTVDVPVEDMRLAGSDEAPPMRSLWQAIHPRLLELIRAHTSTLLFVNNRRSAERLAAALNELAHENLVAAHHGSLAKDQRALIEDALKQGRLRALVATSSLELGIDMGAIDLVIQLEAPPSVASGLQRIGRAGHQVGAVSEGVIVPKYRGDLVACAALTSAMQQGVVEATRVPRLPLDILAQQLVATVAVDSWEAGALFDLMTGAASFRDLTRAQFDGVLDMLSGQYPSDEFAELKPRLTFNRTTQRLTPRESARRTAIINGGTIADRGLYGVFLQGENGRASRVGELDEEMVFESKVGDVFVLGASSWRIDEITFDKVLVSPAAGEPGRLPFWRGDQVARPLEFGQRIGALVRQLREQSPEAAQTQLTTHHGLDARAARNLLAYLDDQARVSAVPDERTVVVERGRDDVGDHRICVMSPLGGQVLAPWSMAVTAKIRRAFGFEVDTVWTNDGFIIRFPEGADAPDLAFFVPTSADVEELVTEQLSATPLFAARFRENAARALLLPRRYPGQRTPLWQLRKRSQDLMRVASQFPNFPIVMETYRECLSDVFDMPALVQTLRDLEAGRAKIIETRPSVASPFASALLFGYVANYIYDGDAPPQERKAQALTIDPLQLQELLGETELRELLDPEVIASVEASLQGLSAFKAKSVDQLHDLLIRLGDLTRDDIRARCDSGVSTEALIDTLVREQRALWWRDRLVPREYEQRYTAPTGPELENLCLRFARTHGPFTAQQLSERYAEPLDRITTHLHTLVTRGVLHEGSFLPGGSGTEYCDASILSDLRTRSLARLRKAVQPVSPEVFTRFLTGWHALSPRRHGLDAVLDVIEKLQGLPMLASSFEKDLFASRLEHYLPSDLDALITAGEVKWVGIDASSGNDGRVALYLTDALPHLHRVPMVETQTLPVRERQILEALARQGPSSFTALHALLGGGFAQATTDALWSLVWQGLVTHESLAVLRDRVFGARKDLRARELRTFRSRRSTPLSTDGRWLLVSHLVGAPASTTQWAAATANQLLLRYGVVTREATGAEETPGGFTTLAPVFRTLEESGRIRRGYFVQGVSAMQFALPQVLEALRSAAPGAPAEPLLIHATDPANPFGALLPWPPSAGGTPMRQQGAQVLVHGGVLLAWFSRNARSVVTFDPGSHRVIAQTLAARAARSQQSRVPAVLIETIDGIPAADALLRQALVDAGFSVTSKGLQYRRGRSADGDSEM